MTGPPSTPDPECYEVDELDTLRQQLEAEAAGAAHWRAVARNRDAALVALKGRTSVRAVLALDFRTQGLRRSLRETARQIRTRGAQLATASRAIPTRAAIAGRQQHLDAAISRPPTSPPRLAKSVLVLVVGGEDLPPWAREIDPTLATVIAIANEALIPAALAQHLEDVVVLVDRLVTPLSDHWLPALIAKLDPKPTTGAPVVAATATLVHPRRPVIRSTRHDLLVRSAGLEVTTDNRALPTVAARLAGADPRSITDSMIPAFGGGLWAVERQALESAGGYRPLPTADASAVDLCLRLLDQGGTVTVAGSVLASDHRPVPDARSLLHPIPASSPAWRALLETSGPTLARHARGGTAAPAAFTFTVAAPKPKVAELWGDWHLAGGLARALETRGHRARVRTLADHTEPEARVADIHVVVRGLAPVTPTPGQTNVLWVISHPEDLDVTECDQFDLVLVASEPYAHHLRTQTNTPVEVLLQATDPDRFRPRPGAITHDVVVVAKSRDVMRPMVTDCLAAGIRPAIYGSGWEGLVDDGLIISDHVDNSDLPSIYSRAGVVLNDHWDTMRTWGFVSNRLFDVLACGTPVVSDPVSGLTDVFGDLVSTWGSPSELRQRVEAALAVDRAQFSEQARSLIEAHHTFGHRAEQLLSHLSQHGLLTEPTGTENAR